MPTSPLPPDLKAPGAKVPSSNSQRSRRSMEKAAFNQNVNDLL